MCCAASPDRQRQMVSDTFRCVSAKEVMESILEKPLFVFSVKMQVGRRWDTRYPSAAAASFWRTFAAAHKTPRACCGCQEAHVECCATQGTERWTQQHEACAQSHIYIACLCTIHNEQQGNMAHDLTNFG